MLLLAPPKPQARLPLPKPTYYVWAMNGKGNSHRITGPEDAGNVTAFPTLAGAQRIAVLALKAWPNSFVYVVGWCGNSCIGHWHNLFGPGTADSRWKQGDIRQQVREFIRPERRKRTRTRPHRGVYR